MALGLFAHFRGALQTDGYAVYDYYEGKDGVMCLNCWAHTRSGFDRSMNNDAARSKHAIEQIGLLYEVERKADDENLTFDERRGLRMRLAVPILQTFEVWLKNEASKVLPKSPIDKAINSLREVMCCGVIQSFLSCHSAFTIFHYLMLNNVIKAYSDSDSSTLRINVFDNYTSYMLEPEKVEKHHLLCRHFRDGQARSLYPGHSFFERLRNLSWLQLRFQDRFHIQLFQKCC